MKVGSKIRGFKSRAGYNGACTADVCHKSEFHKRNDVLVWNLKCFEKLDTYLIFQLYRKKMGQKFVSTVCTLVQLKTILLYPREMTNLCDCMIEEIWRAP